MKKFNEEEDAKARTKEIVAWLERNRRHGEWLGDTAARLLVVAAMRSTNDQCTDAAMLLGLDRGLTTTPTRILRGRMTGLLHKHAPELVRGYVKQN